MLHRPLGDTGLRVGVWGLGAMMLGRGANDDPAQCARMVHTALDAGINLFDTADSYSRGDSERILGEALRGRRQRALIATKVYFPMSRSDPNRAGGSRRWILRAAEDSLRRLQTDYIDLYQLHRLDPRTDLEESLGALSELVRQGKVRAIGTSAARAEQLVECQWLAARRGLVRTRAEQPPYSIFARSVERDVLPTCRRFGIGVLVYSPLDGGWLTGKYRSGAAPPPGSRMERRFFAAHWWDVRRAAVQRKLELVEPLAQLAARLGCPLAHLALAFAARHPAVSSVLLGPRTPEQLEQLLGAAGLELPDEVLDRIDALVPPGTDVDPAGRLDVNPALSEPEGRRRARAP
jgi:aryl-alcohol dehydrogenase (NADP+)